MRTVTLELPDELFEAVQRSAEQNEQRPMDWIATQLHSLLPMQQTGDSERSSVGHWQRLQQHFGVVSTGDNCSADSEKIAADLAMEYADNHVEAN